MRADYHIHTNRCKHAQGQMQEYVEKAIQLQIPEIAFTDHIPLPDGFDAPHRMSYNEVEDYLNDIEMLRQNYPDIKIYAGIEADFYDGYTEYLYQTFQQFNFDIIILAVHFIKGWPKNNWVFSYYFPNRPIHEIYSDYLQAIKRGINTGLFDIVGHLDVIKNEDFPLLNTNKPELLDVLECVKKQSMAVEINTSGLRREIKEIYPNLNILPLLEEFNIPITLGSDAHKPEQVGYQFDTVEKMLLNYPNIRFAYITEGILK